MSLRGTTSLRHHLTRLGPYTSLVLVLIPFAIVEPLKIVAVWIAGKGHWIGGTVTLILAYAASVLVVERLFRLLKPNILKAPLLRKAWRLIIVAKRALALRLSRGLILLHVLARAGYAARATVFLILAYFTAIASADAYRRPLDSMDALESVLTRPLGSVLLMTITVGLICFALWRGAQAIYDVDHHGISWVGLGRRLGYGASGLFYGVFALMAASMLVGFHSIGTDGAVHDWAAVVLAHPFGKLAVGLAGATMLIVGLGIGLAGVRGEFRRRLDLKNRPRLFIMILGGTGYLVRGAVIGLIGFFLVSAALHSNAQEAKGFAGALLSVKQRPHGSELLALAAAGFLAFSVYGFVEAVFRRVDARL